MLLQQTRLALLSSRLAVRATTEVVPNLSKTLLNYQMSAACHIQNHHPQLLASIINDVTYLFVVLVSLYVYMGYLPREVEGEKL